MIIINKVSAELYFKRYINLLEEELIVVKILKEDNMKASDQQIGGSHYQQYKSSPYKFLLDNQIPHHKAAIIRRILRYDHAASGSGIEDLEKIKHEVDLIIEFEGWKDA